MSDRVYKVGIAGCGTIFPAYMEGLARFSHIEVLRCADIIPERARAGHEQYGIPRHGGADALYDDPDVEIVLNITPPNTHIEVSALALEAGKHVYSEKPITTDLADANRLVALADEKGLTFGAAPDTFLGSWGATSRAVVDSGALGDIAAATAFIPHNRVESWHPDPTFLFEPGGGPTLDRGPYYIAALVNLLGPIAEVAGMARVGAPKRAVTAPNRIVEEIAVTIPTHSTAVLRFHSARSGRSSSVATSGRRSCRTSRSTAPTGRSRCPIPTGSTATFASTAGSHGRLSGRLFRPSRRPAACAARGSPT